MTCDHDDYYNNIYLKLYLKILYCLKSIVLFCMMSVEVVRENNPGPLKLEYDITPRDLSNSQAQPSQLPNANFRYQGFPDKNFEDSRHPIFGKSPDPTVLQGVKLQEIQGQEQHSRKQYFDTRNPKAFGTPRGLQYGSSALPETRAKPQPIRGSLQEMDRTNQPIDTAFRSSEELSAFRQRQEESAAEIRKLKQERLQAMMHADAEKKYDMEMLRNYNPWGKPGAGAPQGNNKKQKFTEVETEKFKPSPGPNREYVEEYGDSNKWFGRPGAGAPLRTNSGKLKTEIKGATDIRFQDTQKGRHVYDVEVRYKQDPQQRYTYSKDLEKQIASKQLEQQEHRIHELKQELAMASHDPYGRPGAGAPNKTMSGTHNMVGRSTTLTNNQDEMRKSEKREAERRAMMRAGNQDSYDPWGKGAGQPQYDKYGDTVRHQNARRDEGMYTRNPRSPPREEGNTLGLSHRGGGGAPIVNDMAENGKQTRLPIHMKRDEKGDTTFREDLPGLRRRPPAASLHDDELQIYDPFGKGGAGAPVRDPRGNVVTNVYGNFNNKATYRKDSPKESERRKGRDPNYIHEMQTDVQRFKAQRDHQDRALKFGAGDLASEITRGQVGFPRRDPNGMLANHHLPSTDVTREKANVYSLKTDKTNEYHKELQYAEQQRMRGEKLEKLKERQEARHHGDSQNSFWGRPGGGAPRVEHKKANLDQILYSPRREGNSGNYENRSRSEPLIKGGHKDYVKAYDKQDYHLPKPFATEGTEVL